jgi:adenylate cyclase
MKPQTIQRKLSAILSADVKGYSRLMSDDEVATIQTITIYRELMTSLILKHRGRVVDSPGDNLLAEFGSVVDAVQCAVEIQQEFNAKNLELPDHRQMVFRIGINLGDVIVEGDRIYGDGVNIAARLEGLAEGGGICISGTVYDSIENKVALGYEYLGEQTAKNIPRPVRVYRVLMAPEASGSLLYRKRRTDPRHRRRVSLALMGFLIGAAIALGIWNHYLRPTTPPARISSEETSAIELPGKPSIAVLPFSNMSGDPEQEYFSDGITEDLITALSKFSGLFVIARNSVFTYKGKAVNIGEVGRELGVRYVLEGSVRKAGDRVRITAQLVDATTGGHLWAERYDRNLKDIFALQDEVTHKIVAALAVKLTEDEQQGAAHRGTDNLEAFDYALRGLEWYFLRTREGNAQARQMFQEAIALDSRYAWAYSRLGWTYLTDWSFGWSQGRESLERAFELAQRAIALDDSLPDAHCLLGNTYLWKMQHQRAIDELEKSVTLNPNYADGYAGLADILNWSGRPEQAAGLARKAMRLNPMHPVWYLWCLGHAYFLAGSSEEAIVAFTRSLTRNPNFWPAHAFLAASYVERDQQGEARAEAANLLKKNPDFSLEAWRQRLPYRDQAVLERVLNALRTAGLK